MTRIKLLAKGCSSFVTRSGCAAWVLFVALMVLGGGLRLLDLTDPPLDFHPTRQLRAAMIARGMYYQMSPSADAGVRQKAIALWKFQELYEPQIFERVVALTYLALGGERLWVARLYAVLFWLGGGAALYALARRISDPWGALAALAYYLFVPYGVSASRSFQPDPFMVMWLMLAAYALYRWGETLSWKWGLLAGVFGGLAILVKVVAAFPLAGALLAVRSNAAGLRKLWRDGQFWAITASWFIIPAVYYLGLSGERSEGLASGTLALSLQLLRNPKFYTAWLKLLDVNFSLPLISLGLMATLLLPAKGRALLSGLWAGFGVYGLVFAYRVSTHDYYNLAIIPITALSLAVIGAWLVERMAVQPLFWRLSFAGLTLFAMAYPAWLARSALLGVDYRGEPAGWRKLGESLPTDGDIIALTHDYGARLQYYGWTLAAYWPTQADLNLQSLQGSAPSQDFERHFEQMTAGKRYFLVTLLGELEAQPQLKSLLYDHYPLVLDKGSYVLFDLSRPLVPEP